MQNSIRRSVPFLLLAGLLVASLIAPAHAWVLYDASQGTLPHVQGWTLNEQLDPVGPYTSEIVAGALHLSTLGFPSNGATGAGVWWSQTGMALDFTNDFAVEACVRIDSAPDHSANQDTGWPRPGWALAVYDVSGRIFWIGLGQNELFLSNTVFGTYGSPNTVTAAFNATDAFHVYRIERAAGGTGASLRIDGVVRLTLPTLGSIENSGSEIYFGDPTYWANSESHIAWVRFDAGGVLGVEPPSTAIAWMKPASCPARELALAFRAPQGGHVTLDLFDATGRRVESLEREVAAGESGRFAASRGHRDGLYFYRARLAGNAAPAVTTTGRMVLVR